MRVITVFMLMAGVLAAAGAPRRFDTIVNLETTSEESANVAKGRHSPLVDPADRTCTAALADLNGDEFPGIALARSGAPNVLCLSGK